MKQLLIISLFLLSAWRCFTQVETKLDHNQLNGHTYIYLSDWGITGDGVTDRAAALQTVVTFGIDNEYAGLIVDIGVFILSKAIVISKMTGDEFDQVNFDIIGAGSAFLVNQAETEFRCTNKNSPVLIIQRGRKVTIKNIAFTGGLTAPTTIKQTIEWTSDDWNGSGGTAVRDNQYSPMCGIAIDPFHANRISGDQYPDFAAYYINEEQGGSSDIDIVDCSFDLLLIGVAASPSGTVQNGDCIRITHCSAQRCRTVYSTGGTQTRAGVIDGLYSVGLIREIVACNQIGEMNGTAPTLSNCNIAGGTKFIINSAGSFGAPKLYNVYAELLWCIGTDVPANIEFSQCEFGFFADETYDVFRPPYLLEAGTASFHGGYLKYLANCEFDNPFVFQTTGKASFYETYFEGGLPLQNYSNSPGEKLFRFNFTNCTFACLGGVGSDLTFDATPLSNALDKIILGGQKYRPYNAAYLEYDCPGSLYNFYNIGSETIDVDTTLKLIKMVSTKAGQYQVGDQILSLETLDLDIISSGTMGNAPLGFVQEISGDTVKIAGVPYGLEEGSANIYVVNFGYFIPPVIANTTSGSATLTIQNGATPSVGRKLFGSGIPSGSYVVSAGSGTVTMSSNATATASNVTFTGSQFPQRLNTTSDLTTVNTTGITFLKGDKIWNDRGNSANDGISHWECTRSGTNSTSITPLWQPHYIPLLSGGYTSLQIGTTKHIEGSGTPEGNVAAPVGSIYHRTDGGTGTSIYIKETGTTTSSGWVAK